jgi:hypothetical protein
MSLVEGCDGREIGLDITGTRDRQPPRDGAGVARQ